MNFSNPETTRPYQAAAAPPVTLLVMLVIGLWFFAHPWQGISHNACLYALQALAHVRPQVYRNDLFFLYGSQDDYSFFSPIYAAFIRLFGLHVAAMALLLAGYVLWIGSAVALLRGLLRGFPFWLGLVLIVAMPRGYGGHGDLLRYAESFLTPRLFAEGFTLLSIAAMLQGRWLASILSMAAAFAMHPLMALAGAGFLVLYAGQDRPKSVLSAAVAGTAVLLGMALFKVAPFSRLLTTMDKEWFELAFSRAPFVFWSGWKFENWLNRALLSFSLLTSAGLLAQGVHRRAFLACLWVGFAALLFTWAGTSVFHNVLLIQIQPWRSLWLVQLFSYIAAAWLVAQFWRRSQFHRVLLVGFLIGSMTLDNVGGALAVATAALFIWGARRTDEIKLSQTSIKLLGLIPILVGTVWFAHSAFDAYLELPGNLHPSDQYVNFTFIWIKGLLAEAGSGLIAITILVAVWKYGPDPKKWVHLVTVTGVLFVLILSIATWHLRVKIEEDFEKIALSDPIPSFSRHMSEQAVVYWQDNPTMAWFLLGRSNYVSQQQTAGIIFSRNLAFEAKRRTGILAELGVGDGIFEWIYNEKRPSSNPKTLGVKGLIMVCSDQKLDYIILGKNLGIGVIESYFDKLTKRHFYLYDCSKFRLRTTEINAEN